MHGKKGNMGIMIEEQRMFTVQWCFLEGKGGFYTTMITSLTNCLEWLNTEVTGSGDASYPRFFSCPSHVILVCYNSKPMLGIVYMLCACGPSVFHSATARVVPSVSPTS